MGAIGVSQLLIFLFTDRQGSHFALNLAGLAITVVGITWMLNRYRHHRALYEVVYVWNLKQELNRIHRKLRKIKSAVDRGEKEAMVILNFSYHGSRQLYQLDDNTVTLEELEQSMSRLDQTVAEYGFDISVDDYDSGLLKKY